MASMLYEGRGTAQDKEKSISLYENLVETKAHDAGEAATRLSKIYKEEGDDTKAREYEKLAQSFGYKVTK